MKTHPDAANTPPDFPHDDIAAYKQHFVAALDELTPQDALHALRALCSDEVRSIEAIAPFLFGYVTGQAATSQHGRKRGR